MHSVIVASLYGFLFSVIPQCPVEELGKKLIEKHGKQVKIEYILKTVKGGYKTTVFAPEIGYAEGLVCSCKNEAKKSAGTEALKMLD